MDQPFSPISPQDKVHTPLTPYQCCYTGGVILIASLLAYRAIPRGLWQKGVSATILTGGAVYLIRDQNATFRNLFDGNVQGIWNHSKVKKARDWWRGTQTTNIGGQSINMTDSYYQKKTPPSGSSRPGPYEQRGGFDKEINE